MPPDTTTTIEYLLGEISAKLDTLIARAQEDREIVAKLTERIQRLEAWRWFLLGGAGAIGGAVSIVVRILFHG